MKMLGANIIIFASILFALDLFGCQKEPTLTKYEMPNDIIYQEGRPCRYRYIYKKELDKYFVYETEYRPAGAEFAHIIERLNKPDTEYVYPF